MESNENQERSGASSNTTNTNAPPNYQWNMNGQQQFPNGPIMVTQVPNGAFPQNGVAYQYQQSQNPNPQGQNACIHMQQVPQGVYSVNRCVVEDSVEQAIAKPLSIISLFCFLQIWFSIPAIVFAYSKGDKYVYIIHLF